MGFYLPGKRGTVRGQTRVNAPDACMKLYNGMKGVGTDEKAVIDVVTSHNFKQRQQIIKMYWQVYKRSLQKELDGELSSCFGKLVQALMSDPEEVAVEALYRCVIPQKSGGKFLKRLSAIFQGGLGRTEYCLLSLLCPRTNKEVAQIKLAFVTKHGMDLDNKIAQGGNDLHQDICTLLLELLSEGREEEGEVDSDQVEDDVDTLLAGNREAEEAFQVMIHEKSWGHIRKVFEMFKEEGGVAIEKWVGDTKTFSAELKEAYKAIILLVTNEPMFYADRLRGAIAGAGTDDDTLIRVVVLRSEVDLLDIMEVYERKFKVSLANDVAGDTSGDYKEALLRIIKTPPPQAMSERRSVSKRTGRERAKKVKEEEVAEPEAEAPVEDKPREGRVRGAVLLKKEPREPVEVQPLRQAEMEKQERRKGILRMANLQREQDEKLRAEGEEGEEGVEDEDLMVREGVSKNESGVDPDDDELEADADDEEITKEEEDDDDVIVVVPPEDDSEEDSKPASTSTTPEPSEAGKHLGAPEATGGCSSPVISRLL